MSCEQEGARKVPLSVTLEGVREGRQVVLFAEIRMMRSARTYTCAMFLFVFRRTLFVYEDSESRMCVCGCV